ncbi:hypothetical protein K7432_005320 [Basidiobolus ranarum]|uniref:Chitin-binding type-3 domain-containing protein n=1 Tax=Basidiobolus ranarum TaxID=34480 RepID=A0ABR2W3P9_9FUNG
MLFSKLFPSVAVLLSLVTLTVAHMEMIQPPPRNSKYNPTFQGTPDYNMVNPLGVYPCKGYGQGKVVQTVQAGSAISVKLNGIATHQGGHCQFAISYDGGKNFVVLSTIYNNCIIASLDYSVTIPSTAGSSKNVIFAWAWINKIGNREYYMNCADIEITGSADGYITGPKLLVVNLPGYPTIPEFPRDGPNDGRDLLAARPTITIRPEGNTSPTTTSETTPSKTTTTTSTPITTSSTTKTVNATPTSGTGICNGVSSWNAGTAYFESQKATYNGHLWQAQWWTQNQTPGSNSVWLDLGAC